MKSCPYCYGTDLDDRASRCRHCGAWLEGEPRAERGFEDLRRELRDELKSDRQDYQQYMQGLFNRVQYAATIILALVIGASAWFGFRTDRGIDEVKDEITDRIAAELRAEATRKLMDDEIRTAVAAVQPTIAAKAEAAAEEATEEAKRLVAERTGELMRSATKDIEAANSRFAGTLEKIEALEQRIRPAQALMESIERTAKLSSEAISQAARAPVEQDLALPLETVPIEEKGGVGALPGLLERRPGALGFQLGRGGYHGPTIWKHLDNLVRLPEFRYVVLVGSGEALFGVYDARVLAAALNPVDDTTIAQEFSLANFDLPADTAVPGWRRFATLVNDGDEAALAALPGFVPATAAVAVNTDKQEVLERMEQAGSDWLPVVERGSGRLRGVVERGHITASLLLDIARRVAAPR